MSELLDKQVNAQKESLKNIRSSYTLCYHLYQLGTGGHTADTLLPALANILMVSSNTRQSESLVT